MADLEIIGFPQSTFVRVARMTCEEKGIPYELKAVPPHSPEVTAIHPFGKIPAMRHGDLQLCESSATSIAPSAARNSFPKSRGQPRRSSNGCR